MPEYIERKMLKYEMTEAMCGTGYQQWAIDVIDRLPTADVVEVRHGEWEFVQIDDCIICSECKNSWNVIDNCTETFNYCPICGAKMDGFRQDLKGESI